DQGAPGRDQQHRYPWPPGRAKGAAASAHAATGGASAAGWFQVGRRFFGAQSARSTGPGFWAGAEARATWSRSRPQPRPRTTQPGARARLQCSIASRRGCNHAERFRMPPGLGRPWMQARSGGASVGVRRDGSLRVVPDH
ncbi:hypothetical protein ACQKWADRAFT_325150, partial [Trichoderma austrokoningii]